MLISLPARIEISRRLQMAEEQLYEAFRRSGFEESDVDETFDTGRRAEAVLDAVTSLKDLLTHGRYNREILKIFVNGVFNTDLSDFLGCDEIATVNDPIVLLSTYLG